LRGDYAFSGIQSKGTARVEKIEKVPTVLNGTASLT
jgi:hypothetical protein